jgi:hypothetical protein
VDESTIYIGDRIRLTVDVAASRSTEIQMPVFKDNIIGDFEIKDFSSKTTEGLFGRKKVRDLYYMTIYSVGKKEIPQLSIKYKLEGSEKWELSETPAITIDVRSILPKGLPSDIKDIKGPASFFEIDWLAVGGISALLILLAALIFIYRRMRKRKPVKLPHETALEELEALRSRLMNSGDLKEYFVGISDCVRRYIERVFNLRAPEMTTEEFLSSLHDSAALSSTHKELLKGFMNACDLVKFAKYAPSGEEAENVYLTAKSFIEETKPVVAQGGDRENREKVT